MITIKEHIFLFLILLTALCTYIISSYLNRCNLKCKINYHKYENHHLKGPQKSIKQPIDTRKRKTLNKYRNVISRANLNNNIIPTSTLYSNGDDDENIRKLFNDIY